jgi:hypothetical protein
MVVNGVSYKGRLENIRESDKRSGFWRGDFKMDAFTFDDIKEVMDDSGSDIRGALEFMLS